jgi:UDP-N-acetyl-D-glucosamine dehydrogenase
VGLERAADFDCVVIATDHSDVDYRSLVESAKLVVDTRNATKSIRRDFPQKIVSL